MKSASNLNLILCCIATVGILTHSSLYGEPLDGKTPPNNFSEQTPDGVSKNDWMGIRAAYEAGKYIFQPVEGTADHWQAYNPGQQWITTFDGRGFLATPKAGNWNWGLELLSYGCGAQRTEVGRVPPRVKAEGQRLTYDWDATVQEWWINDSNGLEHGYVVTRRPADGLRSPLTLTFATRGPLNPRITSDALGVQFHDASGMTVLNYTGLKVWDADGKILASRFEAAENRQVQLVVEDTGARYPVTIDPVAQQAYLKASNTGAGDYFGCSVAISGDTVVVGAYGEASTSTGVNGNQADDFLPAWAPGAAYVFVRSGTSWTQQAYLKASNTEEGDMFGTSVAISGDTIVVGASGEDSAATGINGNKANNLASSSGAAFVYKRSGTTWTQQAYLKASNTGSSDYFGSSVAVSGDIIVVGAYGEDGAAAEVNGNQADNSASSAGAAYIFSRSGTTWTQQAYLKASNSDANDEFGKSVAVSGDTIVVGARQEDSASTGVSGDHSDNSASSSGAAYIYVRTGATWIQQCYLKASNTETNDRFGSSVAASENIVVVGASGEDSAAAGVDGDQASNSASGSGAAYVFVRSGTTWMQDAYLKASNTGSSDGFGSSVAVSGDTLVIGATGEDSAATGVNGNQSNNSLSSPGAAYAFSRSGVVWIQQAYLKASNTGSDDFFGSSVSVSGDTIVVGAYGEDSRATGIGGDQTDDFFSSDTGATFIFTGVGPPTAAPEISVTGNGVNIINGDLSPSLEDHTYFGDTLASGGTVTRYFTVANSGTADLDLTGSPHVSLSGTHAADFNVTALPATPIAANNGSTTFEVTFTPSAVGLRSAMLTIESNDADESTFIFAIRGGGVLHPLTVESPAGTALDENSRRDFGSLALGSSGTPRTFTLRNSGTTALHGVTLTIAGANAGDFAVSAPSSTTIPAGGTVTFAITFSPYDEGLRSASLTYQTNGWPARQVRLEGFGADLGLVTAAQQAYLKASNPGNDDRFGYSVAVSGDTVVVGAWLEDSNAIGVNGNQEDDSAASAGAAYVFVRNGTSWTQQAYLKASNTDAGDQFGYSVALSGDTVVIGAPNEDSAATGVNGNQTDNSATSSGAAYVFTRSGTEWTQEAYLKASNTEASDHFGHSVSVSVNSVVVGAYAEDSNATGVNGGQIDNSANSSGAAYVFTRSGPSWTQQAYLKASNSGASDYFGESVAVSGNTAVVGAYGEDSNALGINGNQVNNSAESSGATYIFVREGTIWTQQAYLKASNTEADNYFGCSVAVSEDTVVVGARNESSSAVGVNGDPSGTSAYLSGAAYVFARSGDTWAQEAYLKASNTGYGDQFGTSVAVSGDRIVVGAEREASNATGINSNQEDNSATSAGASYAFARTGTRWIQMAYLKASNTGAVNLFGSSVAVSGDTVIVGAFFDNGSIPDSGAAYVFTGFATGSATPIEQWRKTYFGSASNSGNAADQFDFDHDGLVNLIEWACYLDPTISSPSPTKTVFNGENLEFTYTRSVAAWNAGTIYQVEWSDTLGPLNWSIAGITEHSLHNDGTVEQIRAIVPAGSNGRRFVHLKVIAPSGQGQ